jgi:hypothetical protein
MSKKFIGLPKPLSPFRLTGSKAEAMSCSRSFAGNANAERIAHVRRDSQPPKIRQALPDRQSSALRKVCVWSGSTTLRLR